MLQQSVCLQISFITNKSLCFQVCNFKWKRSFRDVWVFCKCLKARLQHMYLNELYITPYRLYCIFRFTYVYLTRSHLTNPIFHRVCLLFRGHVPHCTSLYLTVHRCEPLYLELTSQLTTALTGKSGNVCVSQPLLVKSRSRAEIWSVFSVLFASPARKPKGPEGWCLD